MMNLFKASAALRRSTGRIALVGLFAASPMVRAQTVLNRLDSSSSLDQAGAWVQNLVPDSTQIAVWDDTVTGNVAVDTGAGLSLGAIELTGTAATGAVTIAAGSGPLVLGNGSVQTSIDLGRAGLARDLIIATPLALATTQTWNIGSGRTLTVSGVISGNNTLIDKTGAGTLVLTGQNTNTGPLWIEAGLVSFNSLANFGSGSLTLFGGTLQWAPGNTADISPRIQLFGIEGPFTFDTNGNEVTLAGNIQKSGYFLPLTKTGSGTLTLTGTDNFSTGFGGSNDLTVAAGAVQVGNGGTSGSLTSGVSLAANTTLVFNRSDNSTFTGAITGAGTVVKTGAGKLTLVGTSSFLEGVIAIGVTGGTVVTGGSLQFGSGNAAGSISGNVSLAANTSLVFNNPYHQAFSGYTYTDTYSDVISGAGALTLLGGSSGRETLLLLGNNTFTGGTTVRGGTLQLGLDPGGTVNYYGAGGTSGSIVGDILLAPGVGLSATVLFDHADNISLGGNISGTGTLQK